MSAMQDTLPRVRDYLARQNWRYVPVMAGGDLDVTPLAQGEYNLNYLLTGGELDLVLRVNIGTQIDREDQIVYEYNALRLLEFSGVTPKPYYVDDSREFMEQGILIMEFLPGTPLDYRRDLEPAAELLAVVHQVQVPEEENHLIREERPLTLIYEECTRLLKTYFDSPLADPDIRDYLQTVTLWADANREKERFFAEDSWPCIVNTEVNSGNFIVNRKLRTLHLVDWEMPRWGDPSQDLCHFCSPLTTLWKTDFRFRDREKLDFIKQYGSHHHDRHLRDTLGDRVQLRDPFVYLRGISWSAMGWVAYQTDYEGVKNPDTWSTLRQYMNLKFIRSLFDPFLSG